jgi:hypothetical protein
MCCPLAHARNSAGLALLSRMAKENAWNATLPAPPPPPAWSVPLFVSPQLQDSTSIQSLCLLSMLSPGMPEICRK